MRGKGGGKEKERRGKGEGKERVGTSCYMHIMVWTHLTLTVILILY